MNIKKFKIEDFVLDVSSKKPSPGGGAVASLSASLGVSLCLMVINLTIGKKKYEEFSDELLIYKNKLENFNTFFLNQIDEDINAYKKIEEVYALSKNTDEEVKFRKLKMEEALKYCTIPPFKVLETSIECLKICNDLFGKTTIYAVSDIGASAVNFESAIKNAYLNVCINLNNIVDNNFKDDYFQKSKLLLEEGVNISKNIYNKTITYFKNL